MKRVGRPKGAGDGELKARILDAAAEEFAAKGFTGARIENVAKAAGCNRAMVYFYFGAKEALFQAVLDEAAEHRRTQMGAQPMTLADGLVYWFGQNVAEPRRIRLVMQEALAPPLVSARPLRRKAYLEGQLAVVRAFQQAGLLRADLDPHHLLTAFLALTSFPACFPSIASITLDRPEGEATTAEWAQALRAIAAVLVPLSGDDSAAAPH
jgi:TetR/AcrR family transcriptional regulator